MRLSRRLALPLLLLIPAAGVAEPPRAAAPKRPAAKAKAKPVAAPPVTAAPAPEAAPQSPAEAAAAPKSRTLTLAEVLASSRQFQPQIQEAIAKVRAAQGKLLQSQGAFDTVVKAEGQSFLTGFYSGSTFAGGTVERPIESWGGSYYGGYRFSTGRLPVYEDERFTNVVGELKAGVALSLLRDRFIDARRFNRGNAAIDVDIAEAERLIAAITVQRRAIAAYNLWVAAGLRLDVYRELLKLARERQAGLERQVELGGRPRIILTENAQNILRRETLVARSEQELAQAANTLSLFWRDDNGQPRRPTPDMLPDSFPLIPQPVGATRMALEGRPDLKALDMRIAQQTNRLALDRNELKPRLDFKAEASQDVGPVGAGGISRRPFETKVGLSFSVPLERRAAKGRIEATTAEIDALERRRQFAREQIVAEIDGIAIDVRATERLFLLADEEQQRAGEMAVAERRRFGAGASDFFLVNVREEAAADAAVRRLDAKFRNIVSNADLAAAAADLKALGLQ
ncbi:TolC family protein [Sphingomonas sp.]|uniref:TolC family protein n=1 Tax=Sphingomonas sp. TaxID=28214 RepID=UPI001DB1E113|nr:TolC family protein [Sphingomonas sp.]MBX9796396.1 TolC family protein [Sphingomonas sp.]